MGPLEDVARQALARHEWGRAYRLLTEQSVSGPLSVDELDSLAAVAYLTGREGEAFDAWTQAHAACLEAGDLPRAARLGIQLAQALGFKGDIGRSSGWVARVRQVLDQAADCVEHGYLEYAAGMCRIFEDGDIPGARELFARAAKVADRFGDRELRALANLGVGRCLIYLGDVREGLSLLDEVMVSVEAGEVSPIVAGDAYCTVIDGCHEVFDVRRGEVWCDSFTRWCDVQPDLVLYRGHCLLHRAELLQLHGRWAEGVAFAREACERLAEPVNLLVIGGAHYVEAELHRLRGELAEAEEAYERAHQAGCDPHPGLSLLRLAEGRVDAAAGGVRRVLAQSEGSVGRAKVLGPYAEIMLAAGDVDAANAAVHELAGIALEFGSPLLRAQAAQLTGAARLAQGDSTGALVSLRAALSGWIELDAPYDAARTRLVIAEACDAMGDGDGAAMERRTAQVTLDRLAAESGAGTTAPETTPRLPAGLSEREVEVLALVAQGRTNRAIAEALFISEKTVTSHLTHIFTKLGVSSRAAATAFAYEHGLSRPGS
ncbi:MAG: helix-turn-helix transcriptional regulator [Actinomycetota bacterium]|nr:helix-turn-helix transcriptional regulator [Actinomycetota bacterium]